MCANTASMYSENASNIPSSSAGSGGFGFCCINSRNSPGVRNINISWNSDVSASGAAMANPFMVMLVSSRVSANICSNLLTVSRTSVVFTPTQPSHITSFVPMATRAV